MKGSLLFHLVSAMILMGRELDRPRSGRSLIGRGRRLRKQQAGLPALPSGPDDCRLSPANRIPVRCFPPDAVCETAARAVMRKGRRSTVRPARQGGRLGRPCTGRFEESRQVKPELCISMDFPA